MRREPTSIDTAEVERIITASQLSSAVAPYAELERIRHASMKHNEPEGIHAALLCQSGWYVHWIEGPGPAARELAARVREDPRHHGSELLHHSRGQRYLLTPWSMMLSASTEPAESFGRRVRALRERRLGGEQYAPTSVLRRLSAPLLLAAADAAVEPESFHRVGVCSANDGTAFQFLRFLADHQQVASHGRRVAGEEGLDSASDYTEFVVDGQPCRVIAISRAGLEHGLRRAFLPDWPHLVLLFGSDAKRNATLMDRVVEACGPLPNAPQLLGVGAEIAVHARMMMVARATGLRYSQLGPLGEISNFDIWDALRERLRLSGQPAHSVWDLTHPGWVP
jgi:hypothetical protein